MQGDYLFEKEANTTTYYIQRTGSTLQEEIWYEL
jgi:hypothetical protein